MKKYEASLTVALDWFQAAGVDRWNFSLLRQVEKGGMLREDLVRDRAEMLKSAGWAWAMNADPDAHESVCIRPARGWAWQIIMMDDLPGALVMRIAQKYSSLAIETSLDNFQVWIRTEQPLDEPQRLHVQQHLLRKVGGDVGSSSGEHFGKCPGYRNRKPGRGGFIVRVALATAGPAMDVAKYLIEAPAPSPPPGAGGCAIGHDGARGVGVDESRQEFRFCLARLHQAMATGRDLAAEMLALEENLTRRALGRGKRKDEAGAREYARRTVQKAAALVPAG
ncbi:MAG: DNA-primase RepB domain-containing protein [Acidiferrobacteraceae bacterium]